MTICRSEINRPMDSRQRATSPGDRKRQDRAGFEPSLTIKFVSESLLRSNRELNDLTEQYRMHPLRILCGEVGVLRRNPVNFHRNLQEGILLDVILVFFNNLTRELAARVDNLVNAMSIAKETKSL